MGNFLLVILFFAVGYITYWFNKENHIVFIIVNVVLTLLAVALLLFTSVFNLMSEEQVTERINKSPWAFFGVRLLANIVISIFIIIIIGGINGLAKIIIKANVNVWKILIFDFFLFTIVSIIFITFWFL